MKILEVYCTSPVWASRVEHYAIEYCGGCTLYHGDGIWAEGGGPIVSDTLWLVRVSGTDMALEAVVEAAKETAPDTEKCIYYTLHEAEAHTEDLGR